MNDDELKDAALGAFESAMAFGVDRHAFERLARTVRDATLDKVLTGLRSENDTTQLRAIIASVEAMRSNLK